jgi:hypothetical protein
MFHGRCVRNFYLLCCLAVLAACSNGRGSVDSEQPPSGGAQSGFTVSGTVAGLDGDGLVVQLNAGNDLAVPNNGTFTFTTQLANAASYNVTVAAQPTGPSQTCTIGNANGTIAAANVTNVTITCATGAFALRGTVSGLAGTGLVLQNNDADDLLINADGPFSFPVPYASGAGYNVSVETQPSGPSQSCAVTKGSGTIGSGDVTDVAVTCATGQFAIVVTVSGLAGSGPLVLRNNDRDNLTISGNGTFQFPEFLASGALYDVRVATAPANPAQNCAVDKGSGQVGAANVTDITVRCMTNSFKIGGPVSNLLGTGLQLKLNNGQPLNVLPGPPGTFEFPALLPSGTFYDVDVARQPSDPAQECVVVPATRSGIVPAANVTNVAVTCTTRSFRIGGHVAGLEGRNLRLRANDGETIAIASNGTYFFTNPHLSGSRYTVTVDRAPNDPTQDCTIARASEIVGNGDVSNIDVSCSISRFTVGGTVTGLLGQGLVLTNNGGNNLTITGDGPFEFTEPVASGSRYHVEFAAQPSNPAQTCMVANGTEEGTVSAGRITNVTITCSTNTFTVGGTVSNLVGTGLVLRNNGADDLRIDAGGTFAFGTPVPSNATYAVTIVTQPAGPTQECTIAPGTGSGTVTNGPVTTIQLSCVTTQFSIGGTVTGLHGSGLQLQNNGGEVLSIAADGPFKFPTSLPNGSPYSVIVVTPPNTPTQACLATNNVGLVSGVDVTTILVECVDTL